MLGRSYITSQWIWFWGLMVMIWALIAQQTQESWTFYIVVATFAILVIGIIVRWLRGLRRKNQLKDIEVRYLIPRSKYDNFEYKGAPEKESYPHKLTVGIGTYTLFLQVKSKIDIIFDPIRIIFDGDPNSKPRIENKGNPFIRERLPDGSYRNWWNEIQKVSTETTHPLYRRDILMDGSTITTYGAWEGKLKVEIPIRSVGIIEKSLDFIVSETEDDVWFLKKPDNQSYVIVASGLAINIGRNSDGQINQK